MKLATIAFLGLTSMVSALPGTPAGYGTTTKTTSTTTTPSTSCSTWKKTIHSSGYTTVTTYKDVTTWVPTTYQSDIPKPYTTKSCSKNTGVKTETRPFTKTYTDISSGYSTSLTTKSTTVTKGQTPSVTIITSTVLRDNVLVGSTVITNSVPFTHTNTRVSTGTETLTKPAWGQTCATVTKTKTDHSQVVTSTPKVTSTPCSVTKAYTTDIIKTESKCTTIGGPGGYGW